MDKVNELKTLISQIKYEESVSESKKLILLLFKGFSFAVLFVVIIHVSDIFSSVFTKDNSTTLLNTALYVLSVLWLIGTQHDTAINLEAVRFSEKKPKLTKKEIFICCGVLVLFILLLVSTGLPRLFAVELLVFQTYNIFSYLYLIKIFYRGELEFSLDTIKNTVTPCDEPFVFIRAKAAYEFLTGRWQIVRMASLLAYALILLVLMFLKDGFVLGYSRKELLTYSFMAFVVISEGWIYYERLKYRLVVKIAKECCGSKCCLLD